MTSIRIMPSLVNFLLRGTGTMFAFPEGTVWLDLSVNLVGGRRTEGPSIMDVGGVDGGACSVGSIR